MKNIKFRPFFKQWLISTKKARLIFFMTITILSLSCKKFIAIDPPVNTLTPKTVFASDELANSTVLGIYNAMSDYGSYASGGGGSLAVFFSLVSDEMMASPIAYEGNISAFDNEFDPATSLSNIFWAQMYARIFDSNSVLEGLKLSTKLSPNKVSQLKGEALFLRAFNYFYLINIYGDVPLNLTTDYELNKNSSKTDVQTVYKQIIADLLEAESLLPNSQTGSKTRATKDAARAMLARVYFYLKDWKNAEIFSTKVISNNIFSLVPVNETFLKESDESIWQLIPPPESNTPAASLLILTSLPESVYTNTAFVESGFESGDRRKESWISVYSEGSDNYYFPYKYKNRDPAPVTEYIMVLRLAEQYLIRAESQAEQSNIEEAVSDIDKIRDRAGLPLIKDVNPSINQENLIALIRNERRIELFSEWGDRWFDLKRSGLISSVLTPIKPKWTTTNLVMPIPQTEIEFNRNVTQNTGY